MASLKETLVNRGVKLMSDPRVAKWMQDERVMRAFLKAASLPGRIQSLTAEQVDRVAKALDLAREDEVNDLKRAVRRLEDEVARLRREQKEP